MPDPQEISPALLAAQQAEAEVAEHLSARNDFLLEAGAGAGKTYSLVAALRRLLKDEHITLTACGATGHFPTWNAPNFD
jgi:DNA helicase-2/ATP-dependent DNA helicase PcrA